VGKSICGAVGKERGRGGGHSQLFFKKKDGHLVDWEREYARTVGNKIMGGNNRRGKMTRGKGHIFFHKNTISVFGAVRDERESTERPVS